MDKEDLDRLARMLREVSEQELQRQVQQLIDKAQQAKSLRAVSATPDADRLIRAALGEAKRQVSGSEQAE